MEAPKPPVLFPPRAEWMPLVERALAEDIGIGDWTSAVAIEPDSRCTARIEAREPLIVCGLEVARSAVRSVDPAIEIETLAEDGQRVEALAPLLRLRGATATILTAERTALNFLTRLCGVASYTARFVEVVAGTRAQVVDTRKTLPGWRALDKYAVACGGGVNHRMGLYDGILIKDNHVAAAGSVGAATKAAIARAPAQIRVQVEVESESQALEAVEAGASFLLLDNMSAEAVHRVVEQLGDRAILEASGGIGIDNIRVYAEAGVHRVALGALTHSAPGADLALELEA